MFRHLLNLSLLLALVIALNMSAYCEDAPKKVDDRGIPVSAREYLVKKYFNNCDPMDMAIDNAIERIELAKTIIDDITAKEEWVKKQLERFTANKLYIIVSCPDGTKRIIFFRDGKKRKDMELDSLKERLLRRLFGDASYTSPVPEILAAWQAKEDIVPADILENAITESKNSGMTLDEDTLTRARGNFSKETTNAKEIAAALGALSESRYAPTNCWASVWLISRMDVMIFHREESELSKCDLETMDSRTFYENVLYSVRARKEFAWSSLVSDEDFLQHVLSPRGTGEPLQRWRKHVFDAMYPEVMDKTLEQIKEVRDVASSAYNIYYQYEGDTTWEDFGMLSSLAVHEGRCEDCSNVLNMMYRALGIPACQAFTPWWGHANGNHAWTWVKGLGVPGDGKNGVKVYVKTWDKLEDVTKEYTPVTTITIETESKSEDRVPLQVWNHEEWRVVARANIKDGKIVFENVGCRKNFALRVEIPEAKTHLFDVRPDGSVKELNLEKEYEKEGTFEFKFDKMSPLGEFTADEEYSVAYCTSEGWVDLETERVDTGAIGFEATPNRLYMLKGKGMSDRPFTVEEDENGDQVILKR